MSDAIIVKRGLKFHSILGDANLEWVVKEYVAEDVWRCEVSPSETDYRGQSKTFTEAEIRAPLLMSQYFKEVDQQNRGYIESLEPGEVVHHHDGFGQYVRCVVIDELNDEPLVLRPLGIVGDWRPFNLPGYTDSGAIRQGSFCVQRVIKKEPFKPNMQTIYESPGFVPPNGPARDLDPRDLPTISLEMPEPTAEQLEASKLLDVVQSLQDMVKWPDRQVTDFVETYRSQIEAVRDLINSPEVEALLENETLRPRL